MTTETVATIELQARRLAALPGWSRIPPDGQKELIETVESCCYDLRHAKETIQTILDDWNRVPAPRDIRAIANSLAPARARKEPQSCGQCAGGWRYGTYLVSFKGQYKIEGWEAITKEQAAALAKKLGKNQEIVEAVHPCECPAGEQLRKGHAQAAAREQAEQPRRGGLTKARPQVTR